MTYKIKQWADNENGWDTNSGRPGIMYVANAIQAWSTFNYPRAATIAEAAKVFNLEGRDIRAAVEAHPWMFVGGPDVGDDDATIEHEGE